MLNIVKKKAFFFQRRVFKFYSPYKASRKTNQRTNRK